jgi:hypothetical protein
VSCDGRTKGTIRAPTHDQVGVKRGERVVGASDEDETLTHSSEDLIAVKKIGRIVERKQVG